MSGWRDSAISASTEISAATVLEGAEALGYLKSAQQRLDNAIEELENIVAEGDGDDETSDSEDDPGE
jgi:exonuclease VII small subunit